MKEIKLRFWNKMSKQMVYDSDFLCIDSYGKVVYIDWDNNNKINLCPHIVPLLYTGLKDKNGKDIYEGDILKSLKDTGKVYFDDGAFYVRRSRLHSDLLWGECRYGIVIGNIYENPELIK